MTENLWGVIIGGVIATIAGVLGPIVQHFLLDRTRKDDERHANQQALIIALHELADWLEKYRGNAVFNRKQELALSPHSTVEALVMVHFPEALADLRVLNVAIAEHDLWCNERAQEVLAGNLPTVEGFRPISQSLTLARSNLIAAISGGERYTHGQVFKAAKAQPEIAVAAPVDTVAGQDQPQ